MCVGGYRTGSGEREGWGGGLCVGVWGGFGEVEWEFGRFVGGGGGLGGVREGWGGLGRVMEG